MNPTHYKMSRALDGCDVCKFVCLCEEEEYVEETTVYRSRSRVTILTYVSIGVIFFNLPLYAWSMFQYEY